MRTPQTLSAPRGQALALFALTFLFLTLMVLMTVGVGMAASRKADLNNVADATAYAEAVATARTFNAAAVLNRAIIAHYVTMAGIEAQMAYVTEGHNAFNLAGLQFRMLDMTGSTVDVRDAMQGLYTPSPRCGQASQETYDAAYEMWHGALFYMSPNPMPKWAGDNVNGFCRGITCTVPHLPPEIRNARADGWLKENGPILEAKAADELKAVHHAIHELASIQRGTYLELHQALRTGSMAEAIADRAGIAKGFTVHGRDEGRDELDQATMSRRTGDVRDTRSRGFERGFADAILGSRPATDLILPAEVPSNADNNAPLFEDLRKFANRSFAAYPGQPMRVSFTPGDISADYTWSTQDNSIDGAPRVREAPLGPENSPTTLEPGVGYSYGRSQGGVVTVAYDDACAGRQTRTIKSGKFEGAPQIDPITRQTYVTLPLGQNVRTGGRGRTPAGGHDDYSSNHVDGFHWTESNGIGPMGCHGFHAHYNATNTDQVHTLEYETLPEEILTFVLPSAVDHGAGGAWGQPVLPVFLARKFDGKANPWALHFTLVGSEVEMHRSQVVAASAAGVAHYHRREHLGEPPNLLNPFWRATLQPMEIDHRDRGDPTKFSQGTRPMARTLTNGMRVYPQSGDALTAYRGLFDKVHGMELAPGDDGVVR